MGFFDFLKGDKRTFDTKDVSELIENLREEKDRPTRKAAEEALVRKGNSAVYPLIGALNDDDWRVREGCVRALGQIGDARAVPHLIQLFKDKKTRVQLWATDALILIGKKAIDPLTTALHDTDRRVKMGAIVALGEIQDASAIEALKELLNDTDEDIRSASQDAIDYIREK
ncbi:MAG: HEAT repeat domain-containing protein [Methanomicrobiaceae archaeon]|nr:HEAT repeat domain-containing protein [Methanomicrobiaceae archaeon]